MMWVVRRRGDFIL
jgi:hypothetical protein